MCVGDTSCSSKPRFINKIGTHIISLKQAVEEDQLSKAWIALWGRQLRLDPSTKNWIDDNSDGNKAVRAAARRVIFLEAHPEQVRFCCWRSRWRWWDGVAICCCCCGCGGGRGWLLMWVELKYR